MSELIKSRVAIKGWVTRSSKRLSQVLADKDNLDLTVLQDAIDEFDSYVGKLDDIQSQVEMILDDGVLGQDIESAGDFRDQARAPRIEAAKVLKAHAGPALSSSPSAHSASTAYAEAKLPKLNLPTFSGNPLEWSEFWEHF